MAEQNNEDLLSRMGIDIGKNKINIDITKTKGFFNTLQSMLQEKAEHIEKDISEGKVDMGDSAGIRIDKEHIDIDLAKTKSFIEDLGSKMEGFLGEIDQAVAKIGLNDENRKRSE